MMYNISKKIKTTPKFLLENMELEIVDSFKYLGHVLTSSRNVHASMHTHIATQAQRAVHLLYDNIKKTVGYLTP